MRIGILTIGDELLIGQVLNTNAQYLSRHLTDIGAEVCVQSTVGDAPAEIVSELERLSTMVDMIVTTGGLGPTHDDRTVESVARFAGVNVVQDEQWLTYLQSWMPSIGREVTKRNAMQANIPAGARLFYESPGTAPGFMLDVPHGGRIITLVVLPGVPTEMTRVVEQSVVPWVTDAMERTGEARIHYRTLLAAGVAESTLADALGNPSEFLGKSTLAFLPSAGTVRLRIGVRCQSHDVAKAELDRIEATIRERGGRWIVGSDDVPLSYVVGKRLLALGHTVAVAESCTGGMLGGTITDVPGSSAWFYGGVLTYTNDAKVQELGVAKSTIESAGAVSREVAEQMAIGVRTKFGTTWGVSITGIAGPDGGTVEKPVGMVWIAVAGAQGVEAKLFRFGSTQRDVNRQRSVAAALQLLWSKL